MCAPAAIAIPLIASAASSAAAAGAQYAAQAQDAKAAGKFQNSQYSQTASIAMENYLRTIDVTNVRNQQETAAASQQAIENANESRSAQSTAMTSAAEAGVTGNSVAALLNDFAFHEAANNQTVYQNLQMQREQSDEYLKAARAEAYGQIASATPRRVRGPSSLGLGLQFGGIALNTFDQYQARTGKGPYDPNNRRGI